MRRSATVTAVPMSGVDADTKLALMEFLLSNVDLQVSARRVVDWLAAHSLAEQAVVIISEPGNSALHLVAEHGVTSASVADFALTRGEEAHPLIRAMERGDATYFASSHQLRAPIERRPFHALPLREDLDTRPHGLLLASATSPDVHPEVAWVARVLGRQVARLLGRHTLAETRFGQERMLLYSIINAMIANVRFMVPSEGGANCSRFFVGAVRGRAA